MASLKHLGARHVVHAAESAAPKPESPAQVRPAIKQELYDALVAAPALPTVYPIGAVALRGFAEALAMEQYPALGS